MKRELVYLLIDIERDYQNSIWGEVHDRTHTVGDYVALIARYGNKALEAYGDNHGDEAALIVIRKIGALAVACMEVHDTPARKEAPHA